MNRILAVLSLGLAPFLLPGMASPLLAQAQAQPGTVSPFDKDDPEVGKLRALNWKSIDFAAQDLETRTTALLAMQQVLTGIGGKASARLELLLDYFDQNKLGEEFVAKQDSTLPPLISYSDAEKIAVAFINSPAGKGKFGDELEGSDEASLKAYLTMYSNSTKRTFDECIEARTQVRAMALFLQSSGKLEDFKAWAKGERKRKQTESDQKAAQQREATAQAAKAEQEKQAEIRRQNEQKAAKQMEAFIKSQQQEPQQSPGQFVVVEDDWDGDTWWPGTGAYYATDAYRGYVRDKFQDRYQNWNNNRPRPTPNRGGGRRGGRR